MNAFLGRDEYSLNSDVNLCAWERLLVGQDLQILSNCFSSYSGQKPSCFSRSWSSRGKEFWQAFLSPETADHGSKMLVFFQELCKGEPFLSFALCTKVLSSISIFLCVTVLHLWGDIYCDDRQKHKKYVGWMSTKVSSCTEVQFGLFLAFSDYCLGIWEC